MFERRLRVVAVAGILFFLVLSGRLFWLQVARADYWREKAAAIARGKVNLPSRRGAILDANGVVLAEDRLKWDLLVRLDQLEEEGHRCRACGKPVFRTAKRGPGRCRECGSRRYDPLPRGDRARIGALLGDTDAEFEERLGRVRARYEGVVKRRYEYLRKKYGRARRRDVERAHFGWQWEVAKNVEADVVREVALSPDLYHGFSIGAVYRRDYPGGDAVRSIVGRVTGVQGAEEKDALLAKKVPLSRIYNLRFGRYGVEWAFENRLAGEDGHRIEVRDVRGLVKEIFEEKAPVDGETIALSLVSSLQAKVVELLANACAEQKATGGAFVAMRPATGEVLVLADWQRTGKDAAGKPHPTVHHLGLEAIVPGSVFKVATAIAALEAGTLDPSEPFSCGERWHGIRCSHGAHGRVDLVSALGESCNQYFAWAAEELGIDGMDLWAHRLGFGPRTGVGLPRERDGVIPNRAWKDEQFRKHPDYWGSANIHAGEVRQMGFGKGALLVSPLQVARLMAILANGGRFVTPTLLRGGGGLEERVVSTRTVTIVRRGLDAVVERGSGRRIGLGPYGAVGKTGTAEIRKGKKEHMGWFAGFSPTHDVAFACVITKTAEYGADAAGPVVRGFFEEFTRE